LPLVLFLVVVMLMLVMLLGSMMKSFSADECDLEMIGLIFTVSLAVVVDVLAVVVLGVLVVLAVVLVLVASLEPRVQQAPLV